MLIDLKLVWKFLLIRRLRIFGMRIKICSKCKKEKPVFEFSKNKATKDGLQYICKACEKQYRKDNAERISERMKQYQKDNAEHISERMKQYYKNNIKDISKQDGEYYKNNRERIAKQTKQYRKDNAEHISKQKKEYYRNNKDRLKIQRKQYRKNNAERIKQQLNSSAKFDLYYDRLKRFEEVRCCPKNNKLLEVKCAYCGRWFQPTNIQVKNRIRAFNGAQRGESRFYCSENCKQACPIYDQNKWPKGFKKATSREVVPLLRQLVLKRDNYTCQMCGATIETAELHVHHIISYMLNKMLANDPDSCITLCKECHKRVHSQKGCRYVDLSC